MADLTETDKDKPSAEQSAAESRVKQVINDLGGGLVSKPSAEKLRDAASNVVKGHDLYRGIGQL